MNFEHRRQPLELGLRPDPELGVVAVRIYMLCHACFGVENLAAFDGGVGRRVHFRSLARAARERGIIRS